MVETQRLPTLQLPANARSQLVRHLVESCAFGFDEELPCGGHDLQRSANGALLPGERGSHARTVRRLFMYLIESIFQVGFREFRWAKTLELYEDVVHIPSFKLLSICCDSRTILSHAD